jgi:hypothetical protein
VRNRVGDQIPSTPGDRGEEWGWEAGNLRLQLLIVIQKHYTKNTSRTDSAMLERNS